MTQRRGPRKKSRAEEVEDEYQAAMARLKKEYERVSKEIKRRELLEEVAGVALIASSASAVLFVFIYVAIESIKTLSIILGE